VEIEIFFTGGLSKSFFDNVHHDAKLICVCKQSCKRGGGNSGLPNVADPYQLRIEVISPRSQRRQ